MCVSCIPRGRGEDGCSPTAAGTHRRPGESYLAKQVSPQLSGWHVASMSHAKATSRIFVTLQEPLSACRCSLLPCHAGDPPDHFLALARIVAKCGFANVQSSARRVSPTDDGLGGWNLHRAARVLVNHLAWKTLNQILVRWLGIHQQIAHRRMERGSASQAINIPPASARTWPLRTCS